MTPGEIHAAKRKSFIEKTPGYFEFLVSEFGYDRPTFSEGDYSYIYEFEKGSKNNLVISNAYHGVDYGFEIRLRDLASGREELLHFVLKEHQDVEQSYLIAAAEFLRELMPRLDLGSS